MDGFFDSETVELLNELEKFEEFLNELTTTPRIDMSIKKPKTPPPPKPNIGNKKGNPIPLPL